MQAPQADMKRDRVNFRLTLKRCRDEVPRLRGERDEALAQVARLTASRDELAGKQGHWKATIALVHLLELAAASAALPWLEWSMHARLLQPCCLVYSLRVIAHWILIVRCHCAAGGCCPRCDQAAGGAITGARCAQGAFLLSCSSGSDVNLRILHCSGNGSRAFFGPLLGSAAI